MAVPETQVGDHARRHTGAGAALAASASVVESQAPVRRFVVGDEDAGQRLDRWLAAQLPETSRTRIQEHIAEGRVRLAGRPARASHRVGAGDSVEIALEPPPELVALPEPIPLSILYEDDDLIAVDKPAGIVVHPGAGVQSGTVANALVHRYGQLPTLGGPARPGIVHRLDKDTSGVLLVARNDESHRQLVRQFAGRRVEKTYLALVHGRLEHATGRISLAIARDLRRRTRMTTRRREGRAALTTWRVLLRLETEAVGRSLAARARSGFTLIEAGLHTGRTHQIRVHFSATGHPVVGDTHYGAPRRVLLDDAPAPPLPRLWLHAARVRLAHPRTGLPLEIRAPLPRDLRDWLVALGAHFSLNAPEIDRVLESYL
ncbi:MAG: RluA family pseudouridine synthase [Acidobacteriota bacterium]|nr:RluA family pseudouridine synthase [Acidobacteriota bacterium]